VKGPFKIPDPGTINYTAWESFRWRKIFGDSCPRRGGGIYSCSRPGRIDRGTENVATPGSDGHRFRDGDPSERTLRGKTLGRVV